MRQGMRSWTYGTELRSPRLCCATRAIPIIVDFRLLKYVRSRKSQGKDYLGFWRGLWRQYTLMATSQPLVLSQAVLKTRLIWQWHTIAPGKCTRSHDARRWFCNFLKLDGWRP